MSFNHIGNYTCLCGKTFTSSQSFAGHKSHCEIHLQSVGKLESRKQAKKIGAAKGRAAQVHYRKVRSETKIQRLEKWLAEKHTCETCGKIMTEYYGSGRFCCKSCASVRNISENTKSKISNSLNSFYKQSNKSESYTNYKRTVEELHIKFVEDYNLNPKRCSICGKALPFELRFRKTCSDECLHVAFTNAGLTAATKIEKRSKNEIAFCEKCEDYFGKDNILHNEPMFNGWDADIIIPKYKLAILWNGPWHYRKVTKSHNLEQVQTRDKIKCDQIKLCGFIPYIIKDNSKFNLNKVNSEFDKLIEYIRNL